MIKTLLNMTFLIVFSFAGNEASITIADVTAPLIALNGESNITLIEGDVYEELGATATDDVDGNVSVSISGSVDASIVGTYTITYTATDVAGNSASVSRMVNVEEKINHIKTLTLTRPETYIQEDYGYGFVQVPIKVMATYEDGQIEEVTDIVTWHRKDKKRIKCYPSSRCLLKYKDGTVSATLGGVTSNKLHIVVEDDEEQLLKINKLNDSKYDYVNGDGAIQIELQKRPTSEVKLKIKLKEEDGIRFKYSNLLEKELVFNQNKWKFMDMIIFENVDRNSSYTIITEPLISQDPYYDGKNPSDIILEKKEKLKLIEPLVQERRGAIRGVSITFRVLSTHEDLKYELINPLKGMRVLEGQKSRYEHQDAYITYLGGADIEWHVPLDMEEKVHTVTVKATDIKGNTAEITFPIKVPKTKTIQTKLVNNELIVTDKSSNLYGMKMKAHNGEDISELKLRSVEYGDVWKKRIKKESPEDVVERTVFILDNMPEALDVKMPNLFESKEKWISVDAELYKYQEGIHTNSWEDDYRVYSGVVNYNGIRGLVIPHKLSGETHNGSKVYMFILSKAQNKGAL